jgi:Xaa-Pro aminopeptidase
MQHRAVFEERIGRVIESIQTTDLDALLFNRTCNIAYLTGVVNSCSWLFVTREGQRVALVMESDAEVYREESIISDIRCFRMHDPFHLFRKMVKETGFRRKKLGLELSRPGLAHHVLDMLRFAFPKDIQFINGETLLEEIRAIKSNKEIEAIKKAVAIAELGMATAIKTIKPGITESEVVLEAEYAMRKAGGRIPVLNYVASGKRSGMIHHTPSRKVIENGDVITMDIHGGRLGYCADLARTVVCGAIDKKVEEAYRGLIAAQDKTLDLCREGETLFEIKRAFYRELKKVIGFKFLTGPVLHGVGIMNHEMPYLIFPYQDKGRPEILQSNMVIAVSNIGLYSNQGWGVRVEDTALVTDAEPVYLTSYPKDLLSL